MLDKLAPGMVYWNPINQQWLIVQNARTKDANQFIMVHIRKLKQD